MFGSRALDKGMCVCPAGARAEVVTTRPGLAVWGKAEGAPGSPALLPSAAAVPGDSL